MPPERQEPAAIPPGELAGLVRMDEEIRHRYFSTYCLHERHANCRLTCKLCAAPCLCPCHRSG